MKTLEEDNPPTQGMANAPVTIVEFLDFECPYCKRMADVLNNDLPLRIARAFALSFAISPFPCIRGPRTRLK